MSFVYTVYQSFQGYLVEALYTWVLESIELTQSKCYKESLQAIKKAREISVMLGEVDIVLPFLSRLTCRAHYGMVRNRILIY